MDGLLLGTFENILQEKIVNNLARTKHLSDLLERKKGYDSYLLDRSCFDVAYIVAEWIRT